MRVRDRMSDADNGSLLWAAQGNRFGTIVADPAWPSSKAPSKARHHWMKQNMKPRYGTMRAKDLLALPVSDIALPDAILALWCTWMHLDLAMDCIKAWGFRYGTGMPWLKVIKHPIGQSLEGLIPQPIYGPGPWFQHCTELVLIARRGKPFGSQGNPRPARKGIIIAPRQQHSRKPEELQAWIDDPGKRFPNPKIELFATQRRAGWTSWGSSITDDTAGTEYCGMELVGGWCKRARGHEGNCACS